MSFPDLLRYAVRALVGRRLRAALSLLGMAIGVAAVVVLTALGQGALTYVSDQFGNIGTNILIIVPGKTETTGGFPGVGGTPNDLTLDDFEVLVRSMREVQRAAPIAMATAAVSHGELSRQVAVIGTTDQFLAVRNLALGRGRFLPEGEIDRGTAVAVIGEKVARELFPAQDPLGEVIRIDDARMRVIGLLAPKGVQLGLDLDDMVVIPVASGDAPIQPQFPFSYYLGPFGPAPISDSPADKVTQIMTERHDEEDVTCIRQDAVVETFSSILGTLTLVLVAIASISLSVAGIGIMNVMLVSVSERTPEVGLLKAVGVAPRQIIAVFVTEAALLSTAGGLVGLAVGWLVVQLLVGIYPDLPASPPAWAVAAALAVSTIVGMTFGVLPARRAARLDPITALARR